MPGPPLARAHGAGQRRRLSKGRTGQEPSVRQIRARAQRANFSMAAGVTGVKKLTRLPSGSRNSSDRLPQGIVVGSLTKSSTKPARFWCTPSTSSTRNSMITVRFSAGRAAPGANSGTVRVLAIARVARPARAQRSPPFVIEEPDDLRGLVAGLAGRLAASARAVSRTHPCLAGYATARLSPGGSAGSKRPPAVISVAEEKSALCVHPGGARSKHQ